MATFMVFLMSIHVRRTIVNLLLSSRDSRFSSHLSRIPFFFLHPRQIYRGDVITSERRGKFFNWHSSQFAGISTTNSVSPGVRKLLHFPLRESRRPTGRIGRPTSFVSHLHNSRSPTCRVKFYGTFHE